MRYLKCYFRVLIQRRILSGAVKYGSNKGLI
jgi:hypothetical protein